jgi:hypothetical protein
MTSFYNGVECVSKNKWAILKYATIAATVAVGILLIQNHYFQNTQPDLEHKESGKKFVPWQDRNPPPQGCPKVSNIASPINHNVKPRPSGLKT